jgi:hypothetical protein
LFFNFILKPESKKTLTVFFKSDKSSIGFSTQSIGLKLLSVKSPILSPFIRAFQSEKTYQSEYLSPLLVVV